MRGARAARGFTLVELVTVMAVLAILSIGTVFYLRDASSGFINTVARNDLVGTGRFALQRVAAEVRDALPTSLRTNGDCLEFLPIAAATHYLDLPTAAPAASLKAVPVNPAQNLDGMRAAVPVGGNPYAVSVSGVVSGAVTVTGPDLDNEIVVSFATPHQFTAESQTDRFYFVEGPVSVCVDGTDLWRYEGYGFNVAQPTSATLPGALPGRSLLAEDLAPGVMPFTVLPATLQRNAVVEVVLPLANGGATLALATSVQVRNVP